MPDVIICYEHINRELLNDTLLKEELVRRGYSCEIIPFNGFGFWTYSRNKNRAKVVLTPWLRYDENVYHYLQLADKNACLMNLQWEQVYNKLGLDSGMNAISGQAKNAFHLCWGENSRNRLISSGISQDNVFVTGAIQLDFGLPKLRMFYKSRETIAKEFKLNHGCKWCLFVSSFDMANYEQREIDSLIARFGHYVGDLYKLEKESQKIVLEWIRRLLDANKDIEFIYRPHPSETVSNELEEMCCRYKSFHVINNYSVKQWALVVDKVNLWISTSNAEILSMGINYEIIRPVPIPSELEVESMVLENKINDFQSFIEYNTSSYRHSNSIKIKQQDLCIYYNLSDLPAYVRVANVVEEAINCKYSCNFVFSPLKKLMFWQRSIRDKVISFLSERQIKSTKNNSLWVLSFRPDIQKNIIKHNTNYLLGVEVEKDFSRFIHNLL